MIHFIQGLSSKTIYLEALLKKLNINNISKFDETNSDFFLSEINSGSLFAEPKIVLLNNADKIKNISQILEKLSNYDNTDEEVIIVYNSNNESKKINDLTKTFNTYSVFNANLNRKNFLEYIEKRLKIKNNESNQLLDLLDEDYYLISNELDKIENFLNGKVYSLDNVKSILSKNSKFIIFELTNDILNNKEIDYPIKEHMGVLSSLTNDFDFKKQNFLDKFSKKDCLDLLKLAFKTELMIKTGEIDLEIGVENFIMNIYKKKH